MSQLGDLVLDNAYYLPLALSVTNDHFLLGGSEVGIEMYRLPHHATQILAKRFCRLALTLVAP